MNESASSSTFSPGKVDRNLLLGNQLVQLPRELTEKKPVLILLIQDIMEPTPIYEGRLTIVAALPSSSSTLDHQTVQFLREMMRPPTQTRSILPAASTVILPMSIAVASGESGMATLQDHGMLDRAGLFTNLRGVHRYPPGRPFSQGNSTVDTLEACETIMEGMDSIMLAPEDSICKKEETQHYEHTTFAPLEPTNDAQRQNFGGGNEEDESGQLWLRSEIQEQHQHQHQQQHQQQHRKGPTQSSSWDEKLQELVMFKDKYGHCHVSVACPAIHGVDLRLPLQPTRHPISAYKTRNRKGGSSDQYAHHFGGTTNNIVIPDPKVAVVSDSSAGKHHALAHWVRRQRHQYRRKHEGLHSTLTDARQDALDSLGFIWNSHSAMWEGRFRELLSFVADNGHCRVPRQYKPNPGLAIWVKCQRRQLQLTKAGKKAALTTDRIRRLNKVGFVWYARAVNNKP